MSPRKKHQSTDSPVAPGALSHAWRALRHRNFKLFFFGQGISLIGTWMTRLATTWLVYRLTQSALLLGIGALVSAIFLVVRKSVVGLTRMLQIAVVLLGCALILFGLSKVLWLSLLLMAFAGFGMMQGASASNTVIQALVPEDKRGRVMSYYTMAFFGAAPMGSLLAGILANRFGAPYTVIFTGLCCVVGGFWFTRELPRIRSIMRPIYQDMGLIPRA